MLLLFGDCREESCGKRNLKVFGRYFDESFFGLGFVKIEKKENFSHF